MSLSTSEFAAKPVETIAALFAAVRDEAEGWTIEVAAGSRAVLGGCFAAGTNEQFAKLLKSWLKYTKWRY